MNTVELYEGGDPIRIETEAATYTLMEQDGALIVRQEHRSGPFQSLAVVGQASNVIHIRSIGT